VPTASSPHSEAPTARPSTSATTGGRSSTSSSANHQGLAPTGGPSGTEGGKASSAAGVPEEDRTGLCRLFTHGTGDWNGGGDDSGGAGENGGTTRSRRQLSDT